MEQNTPQDQLLLELIKVCLIGPQREGILREYIQTFTGLGVAEASATQLVNSIVMKLQEYTYMPRLQKHIVERVGREQALGMNLSDIIKDEHQKRIEKIYTQVRLHLPDSGSILDYGCGSGLLGEIIKKNHPLEVQGAEIADMRIPGINIPIYFLSNYSIPVSDRHFKQVLLIDVLNHDEYSEKIITEVTRISEEVLVIETFPHGDSLHDLRTEWPIVFMLDFLYNRIFISGNTPVPGKFNTLANWETRFRNHGCEMPYSKNFFIDQKLMRARHQLMLFKQLEK